MVILNPDLENAFRISECPKCKKGTVFKVSARNGNKIFCGNVLCDNFRNETTNSDFGVVYNNPNKSGIMNF